MSRFISFCRPETGAVRSEHFVTDHQITIFIQAELKFSIGNDDSFAQCVFSTFFIKMCIRDRIYIDGRWRVAPGRIDKKLNVVNTMKISVPRDAYKIKGMTSEAKHEIEAAINNLKKEYDIRLDLIEVAKMEVGDIFGAAPYLDDRGKLRFALVIKMCIRDSYRTSSWRQ